MNTPITFNLAIGSRKPHSGTQKICPFCHPEKLTGIMEKKGDIIWLMNKFPVFENTWPTVIVETSDHNGELSTYEPEKLHEVISFGLSHWLQLEWFHHDTGTAEKAGFHQTLHGQYSGICGAERFSGTEHG